jgi:hypothetical protein
MYSLMKNLECLVFQFILFGGKILFAGSVGRTCFVWFLLFSQSSSVTVSDIAWFTLIFVSPRPPHKPFQTWRHLPWVGLLLLGLRRSTICHRLIHLGVRVSKSLRMNGYVNIDEGIESCPRVRFGMRNRKGPIGSCCLEKMHAHCLLERHK